MHASWLVFDSELVGRESGRGVAVRQRCCVILCGRKAMTMQYVYGQGKSQGKSYHFKVDKKARGIPLYVIPAFDT